MKKFNCILLVLLFSILSCFSLFACNEEENEESIEKSITVFSWEDYIDLGDEEVPGRESSILDDFEEETGISVNYVTFANSEEMYNELNKNPYACDLMCPSEYMIMKMMTEGKLRSFNTPEMYKKNCSQYIKDVFKTLGIKDKDGEIITPIMSEDENTSFAVGYMWGTMGYVYNMEKYSSDELNNWLVCLEDRFFDKVTIKDSVRDTYILAIGAVYNDELKKLKSDFDASSKTEEDIDIYNKKITEIFNRCDDKTIDKVEEFLLELRENLYYFEIDNAKTDILRNRIDLYFAWSGDAVYAMDCSDDNVEDDVTLGYVVPEEGSNVWFDGFVMPAKVSDKQAELAIEFLNYISTPKSAIRNMEYIGYCSVISGDADEPFSLSYIETDDAGFTIAGSEYECEYEGILDWVKQSYCEDESAEDFDEAEFEKVDLSYFFGDGTFVYSSESGRQLYGLYSDTETITRCAIMDNFDNERLTYVNAMWSRVKLNTLKTWQIILISVFFLLIIAFLVLLKFRTRGFVHVLLEKIRYKFENKDKIVKVEKKY